DVRRERAAAERRERAARSQVAEHDQALQPRQGRRDQSPRGDRGGGDRVEARRQGGRAVKRCKLRQYRFKKAEGASFTVTPTPPGRGYRISDDAGRGDDARVGAK